ncbi:MAG: hypothetical protein CMJ78_26865 [Planctomycetaceae bacterium]|nr:hypothetical protein [Planctomycetaceae bacterium]
MTSQDAQLSQERPTSIRFLVLALSCGTSWYLYLHRYAFALIKPTLVEEYGLGKDDLGLLDLCFSVTYSVFQFPAGVIADVAGAHIFLGVVIILSSIALAMHAIPNVTMLAVARALFGTAQAGAFSSVSRITRIWFPSSSRTMAQGLAGVAFGRIGGMSSNLVLAALLIGYFGLDWRIGIFIIAGGGLLHGLLHLMLFRNSPREHSWTNDSEVELIGDNEPPPSNEPKVGLLDRIRNTNTNKRALVNLAFLNAASTFSTIADNIYSAWIPLFLFEEYKLEFKEMGIYSALPLLGGAIGGACSGFINDWLIRATGNRRWTRSLIGCIGKCGAAAILGVALLYRDSPYVFCSILLFVKIFADSSLSTRWGTVTDISGNATASVFAFNNAVAGVGAMVAPIVYGFVSESFGWTPTFLIACGAYVLCGLSWLMVDCTIQLFPDPFAEEDGIEDHGPDK